MRFPHDEFVEFASRVRIPSKEYGSVPLAPLWGTQTFFLREVARAIEDDVRHVIPLKGRQQGYSAIMSAIDLFWLLKYDAMQGLMVLDSDANLAYRRDILNEMRGSLPRRYGIPTRKDNDEMLAFITLRDEQGELFGGSRLMYQVAGKSKRSEGQIGRGRGINYLDGDEVGWWKDQKGIASLEASLAEEHPHRLYVLGGTANGYDVLWQLWNEAEHAVTKRRIFIGWWRKELYRVARGTKLWDAYGSDSLTQTERLWVRGVKKAYDVEITPEQRAWYKYQLAEKFNDDEAMLSQEHPCLVGSTRISTEVGIIPITEAPTAHYTESGRLLGFYPQGDRQTWTAKTSLGYQITGTSEHEIQCPDGSFVHLLESIGSLAELRPPRFADSHYELAWSELGGVITTLRVDESWGRFLGYFMGDGSYSHSAISIMATAKDADVVDDIRQLMTFIFGRVQERIIGGGHELRVGCTAFGGLMKRLGIYSEEKPHRRVCVPEVIWRSPKSVVREFLRGLFESDGHMYPEAVRAVLFSKHYDFLRDVQVLLLGFGVTCRLTTRQTSTVIRGRRHPYAANEIALRASETRRFNAEVGFISARKQERSTRGPRKPKANYKLAPPIELVDTIVSVELARIEAVYDIGIDSRAHTFSANGIAVHNCLPEDAFQSFGDKFIAPSTIRRLRQGVERPETQARYGWARHLNEVRTLACAPKDATLRVWATQDPHALYMVGARAAGSTTPDCLDSAATVWRLYPDRMEQVAEYTSETDATYQFAWAVLHLLTMYGTRIKPAYLCLDVQATGAVVFSEIRRVQEIGWGLASKTPNTPDDYLDFQIPVRYYLHRRVDTLSRGAVLEFLSTTGHMTMLMHTLRDHVEREILSPTSERVVQQLATLRRGSSGDNDVIEGGGLARDGLAVSAGLAAWHYQSVWDEVRRYAPPKESPKSVATVGEAMAGAVIQRAMGVRR